MTRILIFLLSGLAVLAADDGWSKVRELKRGSELRILKKSSKQPVIAKLDEVTAESVVIVLKNEQVAVPKDDIDRLDARPAGGGRVKPESKTTVKGPDTRDSRPGPPAAYSGSTTSVSGGLSIGSKPDFETIYRRPAAAPKK
ncbi:MAG TPA: hypothetical protein VFL57_09300 [Bryobacteraceae bacterium]|nr:hypothetical protein [Bryobacteraceae bacterium]